MLTGGISMAGLLDGTGLQKGGGAKSGPSTGGEDGGGKHAGIQGPGQDPPRQDPPRGGSTRDRGGKGARPCFPGPAADTALADG